MDSKVERPGHAEEVYGAPRRKGGVMNKLYPPGPQPGAKGRVKNHCRKFWWCDCLVLAIIVLVIILPIIFVAIPKKAQHEINASTLEVTSQEVTNPQADSIHLKLESVIKSDSSYHPTVDGFRAALSLEGQGPFIYIDIPTAKSEAETHITVEQDVKFVSAAAFAGYTKAVLGAESFKVHLNGKTQVHLKGLPGMDVDYNKVVTMKGLNRLSGLNITSIKILSGRAEILPDGSNMIGTVSIPNPSVMTLSLGNVTMNLSVDNKPLGTALLPNLVLRPGPNSVPMQSRVDQLAVITLIQSKYKNAVLPLEISGNASVDAKTGEKLAYYEEAIRSNVVKLDLNVGPALAAVGIKLNGTSPA
ncbi:hypothetical protein CC86DRAFT_452343 [Ophiobolus disseminans]|uniref:Uncharacterized protein n=1 Tax=Ophiobolus disseminans TaxID=1469910 RepID=A0A6A7ADA3_9PLEO|nr:hypothetical protein CC86DRAFT_452343 [Ophiobolus disseminans]